MALAVSLGVLVLEIWPLLAAGLIITPARLGENPTAAAWVAAAGAMVYVGSRIVLWVHVVSGRAEVSASRTLLNGVAALFGLLAGWLAWYLGDQLTGGPVILSVMIAMTLASAISAALLVVLGRNLPDSRSAGATSDLRAAVEALPERDRVAIGSDLAEALAVLVAGGAISPEDAANARRALLGGLARYQWASAQSRHRTTSRG